MTRTTLLATLLLAACTKQIDPDKVADSITKGLAEKKLTVKVTCPSGRAAKAGDTFQCTGTDDAKNAVTINVTQKDDKGTVEWKLDGQILDTDTIIADAKTKLPGADIACARKAVIVKSHDTYECEIKNAPQKKLTIKIDGESVGWEAN